MIHDDEKTHGYALQHQWVRVSLFLIIILLLCLNSLHLVSYLDRLGMHHAVLIQHEKLAARGQIQLILVNATKSNRKLTDEELVTINSLIEAAEYEEMKK